MHAVEICKGSQDHQMLILQIAFGILCILPFSQTAEKNSKDGFN